MLTELTAWFTSTKGHPYQWVSNLNDPSTYLKDQREFLQSSNWKAEGADNMYILWINSAKIKVSNIKQHLITDSSSVLTRSINAASHLSKGAGEKHFHHPL